MNWSFDEIGDGELDSTNHPENTEWLQAGERGCSELVATVGLAPATGSEILLLVGIKEPFQTVQVICSRAEGSIAKTLGSKPAMSSCLQVAGSDDITLNTAYLPTL